MSDLATPFGSRLMPALDEEVSIAAELAEHFAAVLPSSIPEVVHQALIREVDSYGRPSLVRWWPDLWVVDRSAALVDVKLSMSHNRENLAIERYAMKAYTAITDVFRVPVWIAWRDGRGLRALTPEMVLDRYFKANDGYSDGGGSGTSYYVIGKRFGLGLVDALSRTIG